MSAPRDTVRGVATVFVVAVVVVAVIVVYHVHWHLKASLFACCARLGALCGNYTQRWLPLLLLVIVSYIHTKCLCIPFLRNETPLVIGIAATARQPSKGE